MELSETFHQINAQQIVQEITWQQQIMKDAYINFKTAQREQ